jgi:CRP-like cAMP-binding protein
MNCFIKACSPDWIQLISEKKEETKYRDKQHVFMSGEPVFGLYFIKNGKIKVISKGWNEKEQIVRLAYDGNILGHRGFGGETYPVSAIALDESVVCFVDNETISKAFFHNPHLTIKLMNFYAAELRGIEMRITFLAQMTVREKVAFALLYLKESFGYTSGGQTLNIDISRANIASLAGLSEEQVVRNLTDFEKEKLIAKVKRKIQILNEEKLQKMADLYK